MDDSGRTQLEGAGGGAAIGGLAGLLFGGDAKAAAIGSVVGAALGLGLGSALAERKQQYASAENFYDAQIVQTRNKNLQLARYNHNLSTQVSGYRQEIAELERRARSGAVNHAAASRTHEQVQASYAASAQTLEEAKRELKVQQQVAVELRQSTGEHAGRIRQENEQVAALSNHINVLQQQVETLASQSNQLQQFR
jgi:chromosome segregation ATPase